MVEKHTLFFDVISRHRACYGYFHSKEKNMKKDKELNLG
jgi:hypothetical protein